MRCLTLADALKGRGARCHFISRQSTGHLLEAIRQHGHELTSLPDFLPQTIAPARLPPHAAWLGEDWRTDAAQTRAVLGTFLPEWLVVDHYALDARWESEVRPQCRRLMVIDDLADRSHFCDLLLDQTYGRDPADYARWVPAECTLLCGSEYALLRPEFAALREDSLQRRGRPQLRQLFIMLGGVDKDNVTGMVLDALKDSALPNECRTTVVMGAAAPWLNSVRGQVATLDRPIQLKLDVPDMAKLMASSDLAIGAAGTTSWERCCLGLPAVVVAIAANQQLVASALENAGAAWVLYEVADISIRLPDLLERLSNATELLIQASRAASAMTDGQGSKAVVERMEQ